LSRSAGWIRKRKNEEVEEEEVVVEVDERSADSLLWISSAANVLSWIVLVVFIAWAWYHRFTCKLRSVVGSLRWIFRRPTSR
jgi:hypothetical protein